MRRKEIRYKKQVKMVRAWVRVVGGRKSGHVNSK
jgi:hypothetical protein